MPNEDIENRLSAWERIQESQSTEMLELKQDVRELLNLVRLLAGCVQMPVPGMDEEKAAIEFETRLGAMFEKHAKGRHLMKQRDAIEGQILI